MGKVAKNGVVALDYSVDDGVTWLPIPGVISFDPGTTTAEDVDVTDYDSPNNQREYANGFKATSDGNFVVNYDEANAAHQALIAAAGGAAIKLRHQYDTKYLEMPTLIKACSTPASIGEALRMTVTIKAASAPSWTNVA